MEFFKNIFDEIKSRWRYVRELSDISQKIKRMRETVSDKYIVQDVEYLVQKVEKLESDLSKVLNPSYSKFGPLVKLKNGELSYMLEGDFRSVEAIKKAINLIKDIEEDKKQKLTKETRKRIEEILYEAGYKEKKS